MAAAQKLTVKENGKTVQWGYYLAAGGRNGCS